ncbi:hypothetical protein [Eikenella sp. Marseille-P7795]|uniref:hypothetical protein n=1 Tax=Eikenella sp. Marseille-P7795 TaxID=2866577 RepID=UPI001CE41D8E|nr:hypothetical protein [Eikenella sp. Marseille-P7795]
MRLKDKIAIVTGSSSGIGAEIRRHHRAGAGGGQRHHLVNRLHKRLPESVSFNEVKTMFCKARLGLCEAKFSGSL